MDGDCRAHCSMSRIAILFKIALPLAFLLPPLSLSHTTIESFDKLRRRQWRRCLPCVYTPVFRSIGCAFEHTDSSPRYRKVDVQPQHMQWRRSHVCIDGGADDVCSVKVATACTMCLNGQWSAHGSGPCHVMISFHSKCCARARGRVRGVARVGCARSWRLSGPDLPMCGASSAVILR